MLDLATGTGIAALCLAELVGTHGRVIGVDIAEALLEIAAAKLALSGLTNVELRRGNVSDLNEAASIFDHVYCSFAIVLEASAALGIKLPLIHDTMASPEMVKQTLEIVGLVATEIQPVQSGRMISSRDAKQKWDGQLWLHPMNPLTTASAQLRMELKREYDRLIDGHSRDGELWFEELTSYVHALLQNPASFRPDLV